MSNQGWFDPQGWGNDIFNAWNTGVGDVTNAIGWDLQPYFGGGGDPSQQGSATTGDSAINPNDNSWQGATFSGAPTATTPNGIPIYSNGAGGYALGNGTPVSIDSRTGMVVGSDGTVYYGGAGGQQSGGNVPSLADLNNYGVGGGGGGGMSSYQAALIKDAQDRLAFDKEQAAAKAAAEQSTAYENFRKDWLEYQSKNYYGALNGPAYGAPAGAGQFYQMPESQLVKQYYQNNPSAGPDPFSQQAQFSGYTGQAFLNPQQAGTQPMQAPMGSTGQGNATNHVPYGPELTGESGYGATITADGTPIAMSEWQRSHLDPTSLERYASYVGNIAGWNPKDLEEIGKSETGNVGDLKVPDKFSFTPTGQ